MKEFSIRSEIEGDFLWLLLDNLEWVNEYVKNDAHAAARGEFFQEIHIGADCKLR